MNKLMMRKLVNISISSKMFELMGFLKVCYFLCCGIYLAFGSESFSNKSINILSYALLFWVSLKFSFFLFGKKNGKSRMESLIFEKYLPFCSYFFAFVFFIMVLTNVDDFHKFILSIVMGAPFLSLYLAKKKTENEKSK